MKYNAKTIATDFWKYLRGINLQTKWFYLAVVIAMMTVWMNRYEIEGVSTERPFFAVRFNKVTGCAEMLFPYEKKTRELGGSC